MWQSLLHPGIGFGEKILRTLVVYAFLLIGLRLAGKRELSQLNPFDLVVLLLLSNTVQNAIIGNDNSLVGGIAGAAAVAHQRGGRPPVVSLRGTRQDRRPVGRRSFGTDACFVTTSSAS